MVQCRICGRTFKALVFHLAHHHKVSCKEYREKFPGAPMIDKAYYRENVWNNPIRRQKISHSLKEHFSSGEIRKQHGERVRKLMTPEVRLKISERRKKPVTVKCKNCGKEIFYQQTRDVRGNFCSKECKNAWHSKIMKEKWMNPEYKAKMLAVRRSPKVAELIRKRQKEHDLEVMKVMRNLEEEGFRVIPIDTTGFPIPDLIAIKGGNVYAVEVSSEDHPNFEKWNIEHPFDDIWWVLIRKDGKQTKLESYTVA